MSLTQKRLKSILEYSPQTGIFIWKEDSSQAKKGDEAGADVHGYVHIGIDSKRYYAHRLAFLYVEGYFPEHDTDHFNGVRNDNRWENLREATRTCNMQNTKINSNNTSGFPGVCWDKQKQRWRSTIKIHQKQSHLGLYDNKLDAALARLTAEVLDDSWTCNHRGVLVKAIKKVWPEFNLKSLE